MALTVLHQRSRRNAQLVQENNERLFQQVEDMNELKVERAYQEGMKAGEQQTLSRFHISIEPFVQTQEGWFKKRAATGYMMITYFDSLKIGEPARIVLYDEKGIDKEMIKESLKAVTALAGALSGAGFSAELVKAVPEVIEALPS